MLIIATREGHAQTVRLLLKSGVYIGRHLTTAALYGQIEIVMLLVEEGAESISNIVFAGHRYGLPLTKDIKRFCNSYSKLDPVCNDVEACDLLSLLPRSPLIDYMQ